MATFLLGTRPPVGGETVPVRRMWATLFLSPLARMISLSLFPSPLLWCSQDAFLGNVLAPVAARLFFPPRLSRFSMNPFSEEEL